MLQYKSGISSITSTRYDVLRAQVNQKELTYVPPAQKEAQAGVRAALGPAYEQVRYQSL